MARSTERNWSAELKQLTEFIEVHFEQGRAAVVVGRPEDIRQILLK